jgi:hypothetical protein
MRLELARPVHIRFGMKTTTSRLTHGLLLLAAAATFGWAATGAAFADDHHDAWSHDKDGYWDKENHHHAFITHENHRGYWREKDDGTKVFIKID